MPFPGSRKAYKTFLCRRMGIFLIFVPSMLITFFVSWPCALNNVLMFFS
jgi:hypothetical protein